MAFIASSPVIMAAIAGYPPEKHPKYTGSIPCRCSTPPDVATIKKDIEKVFGVDAVELDEVGAHE